VTAAYAIPNDFGKATLAHFCNAPRSPAPIHRRVDLGNADGDDDGRRVEPALERDAGGVRLVVGDLDQFRPGPELPP